MESRVAFTWNRRPFKNASHERLKAQGETHEIAVSIDLFQD
jgi:hypothetical protein